MSIASGLVAVNPKVVSTPSPQGLPKVNLPATDAKTWKKGELGYLTSGVVAPVDGATGGATASVIFAEDQDTATSTSTVSCFLLQPETRLEIYVTNNGTAAAIGVANVGTKYAIYSASNVHYLDVNVTSGADFEVEKLAAAYEPERHVTADTPGKCIVVYRP